jgi:ATP-dependent exoDNAse (exonuclease V) beta subunit
MVGDFQQSIYRDRADLNNYRAIHRALVRDSFGDELEFSVTFRLDRQQLKFVNDTFRPASKRQEWAGEIRRVATTSGCTAWPGYSTFARRRPSARRRKAERLSES